MPSVSVIIPIYNSGRYLERCLDSVLSQSLEDIEVICVDDASVDESQLILVRRALADSRIKVVSLAENSGAAQARNAGLDLAKGDYVFFHDSDDWIDRDYLDAMYRRAVSTAQDVTVNANYMYEYEDTSKSVRGPLFGFDGKKEGFYPPYEVQYRFMCSLWTRLYKRKYLDDNKIRFLLGKDGGEDVFFVGLAELLQEKSYVFFGPYYHYFQSDNSLSKRKDIAFQCFKFYRALLKELESRSRSDGCIQFQLLRSLNFENPEEYDAVRSFLLEVKSKVLANQNDYVVGDLVFMNAMIDSPDHELFKRNYKRALLSLVTRNRINDSQ